MRMYSFSRDAGSLITDEVNGVLVHSSSLFHLQHLSKFPINHVASAPSAATQQHHSYNNI